MHEQKGFAVRRPAMKVGAVGVCDELRLTAFGGNQKDVRTSHLWRTTADGQQLAIRRNSMAAIAARGCPDVERLRLAVAGRDPHDLAALVKEQRASVTRPVRRLEVCIRLI